MENKYSTPLIDREIIFGNPVISGAQISPNGKWISFIKPHQGIKNIWVKPIDGAFENALPVTNDQKRPVTSYFWSRDSQYLLYVQDKGGDENYHLYRLDPSQATKDKIPTSKNLSDYPDVRALIYALPRHEPDNIIIGINDRDKAWHDCYKVNISTGERSLVYKNVDKLSGFHFDLEAEL
jgi:Tol biopolymer transport system component